jgi:hypothetical protein
MKKDCYTVREYVLDINLFGSDSDLNNISSGVVSNDSNVDKAKELGTEVIHKMKGNSAIHC